MPLFRRHRDATDEEDPPEGSSFAAVGPAAGFEPASGDVFDDQLEPALRETARVEHGVMAEGIAQGGNLPRSYRMAFEHVFRADRDGRPILVANAVFHPNPGLVGSRVGLRRVAVCVVELPSAMALGAVQPRSYRHEILRHWPECPTGNPAFDERFRVRAGSLGGPFELPAAVQGLVMARDDWIFRVQVTWFICVTPEPFSSIDEMVQRVDQVMAIVAAFPTTMLAARRSTTPAKICSGGSPSSTASRTPSRSSRRSPPPIASSWPSRTRRCRRSRMSPRPTRSSNGSSRSIRPNSCSCWRCSSTPRATPEGAARRRQMSRPYNVAALLDENI